jgi:DNA-binding NarL/FixJ family response regulator
MIKTVVIVEDDAGLREQLESFLAKASDIRCIYSVGSAEEALKRIPKELPDVVIMDIELPQMSGIDCVASLKRLIPSLEIIVFTVYEDTDNIFRALKAGASGYLIKSNRPANLLKAIRDVYGGAAPLSGSIARKIIRHFHIGGREAVDENLSPRESEILEHLAQGQRYKEIAAELEIGIETVRTHIKRICRKLHVRSKIEAVAKYFPRPS